MRPFLHYSYTCMRSPNIPWAHSERTLHRLELQVSRRHLAVPHRAWGVRLRVRTTLLAIVVMGKLEVAFVKRIHLDVLLDGDADLLRDPAHAFGKAFTSL